MDLITKYYRRKAEGGLSPCILGNNKNIPRHSVMNTLPNCVSFATGIFNQQLNLNTCKWLGSTNACNFVKLAKSQGLEVGTEPRVGAIICWSGGSGAGHVAYVLEVIDKNTIVIWESGWSAKSYHWKSTHTKGNGNWVKGESWMEKGNYKFEGFIYKPEEKPSYTKIEPKTINIKNNTCVWKLDFTSWSSVKPASSLLKDTKVKVVATFKHMLGGTYYISENDFNVGNHYGINMVDCEDYIEPEPKPIPTKERKIGDVVEINKVYVSSIAPNGVKPLKTKGAITKILEGKPNPYLLDNGNIGWINEGCIIDDKDKPIDTKKYIKINAKAGVWCRTKKASFKGKKYKVIPYNTKCELIKKDVNNSDGYKWDEIKYDNKTVYIPNSWNTYL